MLDIRCGFVSGKYGDAESERVASGVQGLVDALEAIQALAKPNHPHIDFINLVKFETVSSGTQNHKAIVWGYEAITEITEWRIMGRIGKREVIVNAVWKFHTFIGNRTGNAEFTVNGKPHIKPEFGGVTLEDLWVKEDAKC